MEISTSVPTLGNAMKAIYVELTQKGFVFCLLHKIARHDSTGQYFGQVDSE
jgi:hypothetical protein